MKRIELIEQLNTIQENIETTERQLAESPAAYYRMFNRMNEWRHLQEIKTKALAYWKRRFNRIILQLGYKL